MKPPNNTFLSFLTVAVLFSFAFAQDDTRLVLATTTSTENSGLLTALLPGFTEAFGYEVDVIAVGTGAALQLGRNGDADVLLVHAPDAELALVTTGAAVNRRYVMYNDFVIVGPDSDPADVANADSATDALTRIAASGATFISRGDSSGTHQKELLLWARAPTDPTWPRYQEVGQGMEAALIIADEQLGYTLTDRGTYLATRDRLELTVLFQNDPALFNPYHVMATNPANYPDINYYGAMSLIAYLTAPSTQAAIGDFTVSGEVLFFPAMSNPTD
ncbi:MAG: substrate-binding domain-containing protein [Trueperaceae bacterium]|nr:substrate-binding domain-containing protein [Trueperaceae bacterium]